MADLAPVFRANQREKFRRRESDLLYSAKVIDRALPGRATTKPTMLNFCMDL